MIAEVLEAHTLEPTLTKDGKTMWTCKAPNCEHSVPAEHDRHRFAQAAHQAPLVLEMLKGI